MNGFIGYVTGKRIGGPSPLLKLIPLVAAALPSVEYDVWEWNTKGVRQFIFGHRKLHIIAHSFGCMTAWLLAQQLSLENERYTDDTPLDVEVHLTLIDPIRWNTADQVEQLDGFDEQAIAQWIDPTPFEMPSAVKTCVNYFAPGGLFRSSLIAEREGCLNVPVNGTTHNGIVAKVTGDVVARAVGLS